METISTTVKVSIPNYLASLPIPNSIMGWFSLGLGDLLRLIPFGVAVGGSTYLGLIGLANTPVVGPAIKDKLKKVPGFKPASINPGIKKEQGKVVDTIDIEDMGDKVKQKTG